MTNELEKDALKQGRSTVMAVVATCLLWLLTAGAVRNSLLLDQQARELAAWLAIREMLPESLAADMEGLSRDHPTTCIMKLIPVQSGTEVEECVPILIHLPWLGEGSQEAQLVPADSSDWSYHIAGVESELPIEGYSVGIVERERIWIFPRELSFSSLREMFNAALRDEKAVPRGWPAIGVTLRSRGWNGRSAEDLRLEDKVVAGLIGEAFSETYSISGLALSPRLYPAAVSMLIAALGFLLLGPVLALRRSNAAVTDNSWIMLAQIAGWPGRIIAIFRYVAAILVVLLPFLVVVSQWRLLPMLRETSAILVAAVSVFVLPVAGVVAAFALVVQGMARRVAEQSCESPDRVEIQAESAAPAANPAAQPDGKEAAG